MPEIRYLDRAVTVRQPWAGCIAHIGKNVENRTWPVPPHLIGATVAVHAGKTVERHPVLSVPDGEKFATLFASPAEWDAWRLWNLGRTRRDEANWPPKLATGAIVAVATLAGCHQHVTGETCGDGSYAYGIICSPWARPDQWHWQLADVRPLPSPVPCNGSYGLWPLPDETRDQVFGQLATAGRGT